MSNPKTPSNTSDSEDSSSSGEIVNSEEEYQPGSDSGETNSINTDSTNSTKSRSGSESTDTDDKDTDTEDELKLLLKEAEEILGSIDDNDSEEGDTVVIPNLPNNTKDYNKEKNVMISSDSSNDDDDEDDELGSLEEFIGNHPDDKDLSKESDKSTVIKIPIEALLFGFINQLANGALNPEMISKHKNKNKRKHDDESSSDDSDFLDVSEDGGEKDYKNPNCAVMGDCDTCKKEYRLRKRKASKGKDKQPKKKIKRTKVDIEEKVTSLDELLAIIDKYQYDPKLEYPINIKQLKALKIPLLELKGMIGLEDIKQQIVDQVLYLLSHLQDDDQMLHTAIYGNPGCGKSSLGIILSKVYAALGYSNGKFKIAKASDLIAGYIGQTAIKTQEVIDEAKGGVLFIDEAYALGSRDEGRDGFTKEALDCLNQNLTERRTEFICIIAGYKDQLEQCFFSYNPGLNRRFPFRYEIKEYTVPDLFAIFHRRISLTGWTIDHIPLDLFKKHEKYLTEQGGDMEIIAQTTKLAYSRRTFGKHQTPPKHLMLADVEEGFKMFLNNDEVKSRSKREDREEMFKKYIQPTMYV